MEIVLADGRVLKTGFGHYKNSKAQYVYRYGVGPFLDGIFSQSNFGIITSVGLWLMPEPESFKAFFFSCPRQEDLEIVLERLAPLKLQGLIQSAVHIANDLRTVSSQAGFPWELTQGETPLSADHLAHLRSRYGIGQWNGCGAIVGPKSVVKAIQTEIQKALKPYRPIFLDDFKLSVAEKLAHGLGRLGLAPTLCEKIKFVRPTYEMLKGAPVSHHLPGVAWRLRNRQTLSAETLRDPIQAGVGLAWVSPLLALDGKQAREVVELMTPIYQRHGFDFLATFTLLTERSLVCVTNISFDPAVPGEATKAKQCYEALSVALTNAGFIPYRTGPAGFSHLAENSSVFWDVVADLKDALDPCAILSPGRYSPTRK